MNNAARKNVLVTGGAGYIGSHTCKILAREGYQPIAFDNLSSGHAWAAKWGPLERGDILDRAALDRAIDEVPPERLPALCRVRLRWRVGFRSRKVLSQQCRWLFDAARGAERPRRRTVCPVEHVRHLRRYRQWSRSTRRCHKSRSILMAPRSLWSSACSPISMRPTDCGP